MSLHTQRNHREDGQNWDEIHLVHKQRQHSLRSMIRCSWPMLALFQQSFPQLFGNQNDSNQDHREEGRKFPVVNNFHIRHHLGLGTRWHAHWVLSQNLPQKWNKNVQDHTVDSGCYCLEFQQWQKGLGDCSFPCIGIESCHFHIKWLESPCFCRYH